VDSAKLVLALIEEAYQNKTWHEPNLWQSLKGVSARQAAWRPGRGRHNISGSDAPCGVLRSMQYGEKSKAGSVALSR